MAVGGRVCLLQEMTAVSHDAEILAELTEYGHDLRDLERYGDAEKVWTPVARMKLRMPELVCIQCGLRVVTRRVGEGFALAHGDEQARRWSFGFVDDGKQIACWPDASTEEGPGSSPPQARPAQPSPEHAGIRTESWRSPAQCAPAERSY